MRVIIFVNNYGTVVLAAQSAAFEGAKWLKGEEIQNDIVRKNKILGKIH